MENSSSLAWRGLVFVTLALVSATSPAQALQTVNEQTFFKLQRDWAEARKTADMRFLESFYAKEFTVESMTGGESTRAQDSGCSTGTTTEQPKPR